MPCDKLSRQLINILSEGDDVHSKTPLGGLKCTTILFHRNDYFLNGMPPYCNDNK